MQFLLIISVILFLCASSRTAPHFLHPMTSNELTVPFVEADHGSPSSIVLSVSDVDRWNATGMTIQGILSFVPGRLGEGNGASFRPSFTILKPGQTTVEIHHLTSNQKYHVLITISHPLNTNATKHHHNDNSLVNNVGRMMRRLVGSNCVQVELGKVSRYYTCVGCIVEEAMGCIDDMRQNKSGNVAGACKMNAAREGSQKEITGIQQQKACCPIYSGGKLMYPQSAFNMALECIRKAGCSEGTVYKELLSECSHMCDRVSKEVHDQNAAEDRKDNGWYDDTLNIEEPQFDVAGSVCLGTISAAHSSRGRHSGPLLSVIVTSLALIYSFHRERAV